MLFPGNGASESVDTLEDLVPRVVRLLQASTKDENGAAGAEVRTLQSAIDTWKTAAANAEIDRLAAQYYEPVLREIAAQELNHAAICMLARPVNLMPGESVDSVCATAIRALAPTWLTLLPEDSNPTVRLHESVGGRIRRRIIIQVADLLGNDPRSVELLSNMRKRELSWKLLTFSEIAAHIPSRPMCLQEDERRIWRLEGLCKIYPPDGDGETESRAQITHAGTEVLQILQVA